MTRTRYPWSNSLGTKTAPTYPAPPVTTTFSIFSFAIVHLSRKRLVGSAKTFLHIFNEFLRSALGFHHRQTRLGNGARRRMERIFQNFGNRRWTIRWSHPAHRRL